MKAPLHLLGIALAAASAACWAQGAWSPQRNGGFRGIVAPKGLTPEQIAYWESALRRASELPEWQDNLRKNYWFNVFLTGKEFRKDLDETYAAMKSVLVDLGLAKQ